MIGDGGHAKQVKAEFGDVHVIAIGDNRKRKQVAGATALDTTKPFATAAYVQYQESGILGRIPVGVENCLSVLPVDSGTVILKGALIGAGVTIGKHCILNHQCTVDHDVVLEDYVHVAPGARVLGGAKIGEGALIGANAVVLPNAIVPPWAIVRACTVFPNDYLENARGKVRLKYQKEPT